MRAPVEAGTREEHRLWLRWHPMERWRRGRKGQGRGGRRNALFLLPKPPLDKPGQTQLAGMPGKCSFQGRKQSVTDCLCNRDNQGKTGKDLKANKLMICHIWSHIHCVSY
jgi:hypothetical protein